MRFAWTLAAVACLGCGGFDEIGQARYAATVDEQIDSGCSTAVVIELSKQIADEVSCIEAGSFVELAEGPGLEFRSAAVLPYLTPGAVADLEAAVAAGSGVLQINSAYRTVVQQYLLYEWYLLGRCGITAAARPGRSNHESGRALDINNYNEWKPILEANGWDQSVPGDPVHFDHIASPDLRGLDVLAFQRLWNRNNPGDVIDEDGVYGPQTEMRMGVSPVEGFAMGPCNNDPGTIPPIDLPPIDPDHHGDDSSDVSGGCQSGSSTGSGWVALVALLLLRRRP